MAATPTDPFDWLGIQAAMQLDPIAQVTAAQQGPPASPKAMLDAYRAMNNGALPPGMTIEQATMIDLGVSAEALAANPQLAAQLQSLAATRVQQQADFAAARDQVGQNYQTFTGNIENSGTAWMADLAARMGITPQQAALDPTIAGYGQDLTAIGNTADLNQATDQAWFDKMAQVYSQQNTGLQQSLLAAPPVEAAGSGGGGGGGGGGYGGRGRRGYGSGGGGSDGNWTDPKTTDALTQNAVSTAAQYNPGFYEEALAIANGDPEAAEAISRVLADYGKAPRDVDAGLSTTELPNLETAMEAFRAQQAQRGVYKSLLPTRLMTEPETNYDALIAAVKNRLRADNQVIPSEMMDANGEPVGRALDAKGLPIPESEWLRGVMLPEEKAQATSLLTAKSYGDKYQQAKQEPGGIREGWDIISGEPGPSVFRSLRALRNQNTGVRALSDYDRMLQEKAAADDPNFTYEGWKGYVEPVDVEQDKENNWLYDLFTQVAGKAREFDPNISMQETQRRMTDTASMKTTQSSKAPEDQLFDNNIPEQQASEPYSGFNAFGTSRGFALSEAAQRLIRNQTRRIEEKQAETTVDPVGPTRPLNAPSQASRAPRVASTARPALRAAPSLPVPKETPNWLANALDKPKPMKVVQAKTPSKKKAAAKRPAKKTSTANIIRY